MASRRACRCLTIALVELAATIPADIKFADGHLKHVFRKATPVAAARRASPTARDKMGFPVPSAGVDAGPGTRFRPDVFSSRQAREREIFDNAQGAGRLGAEHRSAARCGDCCASSFGSVSSTTASSEFKEPGDDEGRNDEGADHRRGRVHRLASGRPAVGGAATRCWLSTITPPADGTTSKERERLTIVEARSRIAKR